MAKPTMRVRYKVDFKIDQGALRSMLESPTGMVGTFITRMGERTAAGARSQAPVKTGALRASITMHRGVAGIPGAVEVGAYVDYAYVVHEGRGAITISPKSPNQFLKFPNKAGVMVFMPKVEQKARDGQPFLWNALLDAVASMT